MSFASVTMMGIYRLHFDCATGGSIVYIQAVDYREAIALAAPRVAARQQHFGASPLRLRSVHLVSDSAARRLLETAGAR